MFFFFWTDITKPSPAVQAPVLPGMAAPASTSTWPTPVWPMPKSSSADTRSSSRASPSQKEPEEPDSSAEETASCVGRSSGSRWRSRSWRIDASCSPTAFSAATAGREASTCCSVRTGGSLTSAGSARSRSTPETSSFCRLRVAVVGERKSDGRRKKVLNHRRRFQAQKMEIWKTHDADKKVKIVTLNN